MCPRIFKHLPRAVLSAWNISLLFLTYAICVSSRSIIVLGIKQENQKSPNTYFTTIIKQKKYFNHLLNIHIHNNKSKACISLMLFYDANAFVIYLLRCSNYNLKYYLLRQLYYLRVPFNKKLFIKQKYKLEIFELTFELCTNIGLEQQLEIQLNRGHLLKSHQISIIIMASISLFFERNMM